MPVAIKIALAVGAVDYNVLQVRIVHAVGCAVADWAAERGQRVPGMCSSCVVHRSSLRRQEVDHLNFRVILKQSASEGLAIGLLQQPADMEQLKKVHNVISGWL